jgi:hypothetical protein
MLSYFAQTITGLSLMLSVQSPLPGWSSISRSTADEHRCTSKSHRHVKRVAVKAAPRGTGLVEQRRSPDVQVISFGP